MELKLPVSDAAPYPALRIQGPSPVCVQAMLENIGSCHSEMTAIALYLYDSVLTRERWPKIAEYFHHIMIVEMRHLELFPRKPVMMTPNNFFPTYSERDVAR